jgi:hypothetical protein
MDKVPADKRRTWSLDTKLILAVLFSFLGGMNVISGIDDFFTRKDHYHWAFNMLVGLAFFLSAVAFAFRSSVKSGGSGKARREISRPCQCEEAGV